MAVSLPCGQKTYLGLKSKPEAVVCKQNVPAAIPVFADFIMQSRRK